MEANHIAIKSLRQASEVRVKREAKHKRKICEAKLLEGVRHKREPKQGNEEGPEGEPRRGGNAPGPREKRGSGSEATQTNGGLNGFFL